MYALDTASVDTYLRQMGNIPRLTVQEEIALGKRIEQVRRRLRHSMLANGYVMRCAFRLLEKVRDGKVRLDRTLDVNVKDIQEKRRLLKLLTPNLHTARQLFRRNMQDFDVFANLRHPAERRRTAWQRFVARRERIVRLLEEAQLRTTHLQLIYQGLPRIVRRLDNLNNRLAQSRTSPSDADRAADLRKRRRRVMSIHLETPSVLRRGLIRTDGLRQEYDAARQELAAANLRLVVWIARQYGHRGVSFADLIQEGNSGLMQAVDRHRVARGCRFSTCAVLWIRQAMRAAIARQTRMLRVPPYFIPQIEKVRQIVGRLTHSNGREPGVEQVAEIAGLPEEEAAFLLGMKPIPLSLDEPADGDEDPPRGDIIQDRRSDDLLSRLNLIELRNRIEECLQELTPREREIIRLRFGLYDGHTHTLAEVGRTFEVTRERIRQIEVGALRKLQAPCCASRLSSFLDRVQPTNRNSTQVRR